LIDQLKFAALKRRMSVQALVRQGVEHVLKQRPEAIDEA
jgi:hypothetical protein